jgi:hypothetical protein
MTEQESKQAPVIPLSRFRAALARPKGSKRVDALLSADDPEAEVRALSVPELYFLIDEVGLGDCTELLALADSEQVQGCFDMEIWDRDQMQMEALLPWMGALQEMGFEHFAGVWQALDPELTALTLRRNTEIYDLSLGDEPPEDEERPAYTTPDSFFHVVFTSEDEEVNKQLYRIIEDLYRADLQLARHALMGARSELPSYLEEMSYRWRSGRMADLGYVDFYEALEVFRPIDPGSVRIGEGTAAMGVGPIADERSDTLPVPVLEPVVGRSFLARALEQISDARTVEGVQSALLYLVNRALSASRVPPGNREAVELASLHVAATTALGLEYVSDGDLDRAVEALTTISLTRLHRLGYTLGLRLARFARVLAPRALCADARTQRILEALLGRRPFYPVALESEASSELRPLESLRDLSAVADQLKVLALRIATATALGADLLALAQVPEPRPLLDDFVRTALIHGVLRGELNTSPLSAEDLGAFSAALHRGVSQDRLHELAALLTAELDRQEVVEGRDALPRLFESWWKDLEETFGAIEGDVDPRYVDGVLTAAAKD